MATKTKTNDNTKVLGLDLGVQLDERVLRWWIIIVIESAFALLVSLIIIIPQIQTINKINDELKKQQKIASDLAYKAELLANFSVELSQYESVITSIFPAKKDTGLILLNLRKMIQDNQVDLKTYTIRDTVTTQTGTRGKATSKATQGLIYVDMVVEGTANNIKNLLQTINGSLPLKHVEDFEVVKSLAGPQATVSANIDRVELVQAKIIYAAPFAPFDLNVDSQKPITPYSATQTQLIEDFRGYRNYLDILQTQSPSNNLNSTPNPQWIYQE